MKKYVQIYNCLFMYTTYFTYFIIYFQTMAVLNPLKQADHTIMQDTDLAGPLVFCLAFGGTLMLVSGRN